MDYYGSDRKLSELGEQDLDDFLDQDMFTPPTNDPVMDTFGLVDSAPMDSEWLANFFDDPVLNDRMMTDALQPRRVQSEHSYSLTNGEKITLDGQVKLEKDMETDLLGNVINPNMAFTTAAQTSTVCTPITIDTTMSTTAYRPDPFISDSEITMATNSIATTAVPLVTPMTHSSAPHPHTLLKQPTIILTSQHSPLPAVDTSILASAMHQEHLILPKVNVKMEPSDTASDISSPEHTIMYDSIGLPPTPPSSSTSDSEGSLSPQRSAPPSPIRHSQLLRQHTHTQHTLGGASAALSQPLFSSPIPTSGMLILSEEEKRTLVAEGYPIPNKLPLTKQEEKNLKKIRRKIKNKISAQESRRKKKEYLETLEKKVESYNSENLDLRKKVDLLENNNRSLIGQLQKLQSLVAKVPRPSSASSTQTGTCLMVMVLFFAVFLGTWSPMTLGSIGYHGLASVGSSPVSVGSLGPVSLAAQSLNVQTQGPAIGPEIQEPLSDPYATPSMRSRVLLSIREDQEDKFGPRTPQGYKNFFIRWFSGSAACINAENEDEAIIDYTVSTPSPYIDASTEKTTEEGSAFYPTDLSTNYTSKVMTTSYSVNTTA